MLEHSWRATVYLRLHARTHSYTHTHSQSHHCTTSTRPHTPTLQSNILHQFAAPEHHSNFSATHRQHIINNTSNRVVLDYVALGFYVRQASARPSTASKLTEISQRAKQKGHYASESDRMLAHLMDHLLQENKEGRFSLTDLEQVSSAVGCTFSYGANRHIQDPVTDTRNHMAEAHWQCDRARPFSSLHRGSWTVSCANPHILRGGERQGPFS